MQNNRNPSDLHCRRKSHGPDLKLLVQLSSEICIRKESNAFIDFFPDKEALQGVHFIPVANGTRLARASSLYARINMDLAPFVFELPSAYLPYVQVLGHMGMQDAPSFESMKHLLQQLQKSCGYQRLNPNELRAVLRILQFICDKGNRMSLPAQNAPVDDAIVPDDGARLIHARSCVYVDALGANLVGEIESSRMKFVHPLVGEKLCLQLGVRKLSEVVVEVSSSAPFFFQVWQSQVFSKYAVLWLPDGRLKCRVLPYSDYP